MSRCVVIAGGGTGGHIFPGLAVIDELQSVGVDCHWLGARRGLESKLVGDRGIPLIQVDIEGISARGWAAALRAGVKLPRAISTAVSTLLGLDPISVLGVGGYASAAGLMAAGLLGIPWVLQEQNSAPGLTNRALAPWADLICCGFADALSAFPSLPAEWSGNPVRDSFFEIGEPTIGEPPNLLVLGGSQGSLFLNRTFPRALALLKEAGITPMVRHQAGVRWSEVVRTSYKDLQVEAEVSAFLAEPWQAMAEADLVVARSGALTISELAAAGRGSLLVPFAAAAANHQERNARSLEAVGGALVITEIEASPQRLAMELQDLLGDPEKLLAMARSAQTMARPNAARRISRRLLSVGGAV
jgi:UDP-N-acetylglucosamine--N-acetylmuramyl-(pentapeptide) pyrophosphoryl-undecaprenol N-acetylglucosamine transferase